MKSKEEEKKALIIQLDTLNKELRELKFAINRLEVDTKKKKQRKFEVVKNITDVSKQIKILS
jgi:hypothetical protein